jgi:hypothetical protein
MSGAGRINEYPYAHLRPYEFNRASFNWLLFNSGGGYRIDDHHQVDFHVGIGLDRNAPNYIFGVGYSFRIDSLFRRIE